MADGSSAVPGFRVTPQMEQLKTVCITLRVGAKNSWLWRIELEQLSTAILYVRYSQPRVFFDAKVVARALLQLDCRPGDAISALLTDIGNPARNAQLVNWLSKTQAIEVSQEDVRQTLKSVLHAFLGTDEAANLTHGLIEVLGPCVVLDMAFDAALAESLASMQERG